MKRIISLLLLSVMLFSGVQSAALAVSSTASSDKSLWDITRIGGADRIETANLICRTGWEDAPSDSETDSGTENDPDISDTDIPPEDVSSSDVSSSDVSASDVSASDTPPEDNLQSDETEDDEPVCAIIANGYEFADALAGVPLAAALNAPILLTNGTQIRDSVIAELDRTGTELVYILGGNLAVSFAAEDHLTSLGYEVKRLAGTSRYQTAVAAARELERITGKAPETIFIACGYNYPDALSAGAAAGLLGAPILYSNSDGAPDSTTASYIQGSGIADIVILGGTAAISGSAESSFGRLTEGSISRISGANRYATATEIYKKYSTLFTGKKAIIASGNDFPDALAGGAFAAVSGHPMLLINSLYHTEGLFDLMKTINPEGIYVLGGTSAVSDNVINTVLSGGSLTRPTTSYVPTPGVREQHITRRVTVKLDSATVHSDLSRSSSVVATVKKGQSFTSIKDDSDSKNAYTWFQIEVNGKKGWICRTDVTISNTFTAIPDKIFTAEDKAVIYLSPSCQGSNSYATGKTSEQKEMEAVAKVIKQILDREYDCITYLATFSKEIEDRPDEALSYGADIYVAIHSNATGTSAQGFGASSYYFPACSQGRLLSQNLVAELNKIAPRKTTLANQVINGMNAFSGIGYGEVRWPSDIGMVAILAETEFHDNKIGSDWIQSHHNEIARAYVNALVKTFDIPEK